jgi:hypothetical protein
LRAYGWNRYPQPHCCIDELIRGGLIRPFEAAS